MGIKGLNVRSGNVGRIYNRFRYTERAKNVAIRKFANFSTTT